MLTSLIIGITLVFSGCQSPMEPTAAISDSLPEITPIANITSVSPTAEVQASLEPLVSPIPTPVLEVYKIQGFYDQYGAYRVVGLLKNNTDQFLDNIEVEVTIFDSEGDLLYSDVVYTLLYTLAPGESTPFELLVRDSLSEAQDVFGAAIGFDSSNLERQVIQTRNSVVAIDENGNLHITGELFNNTQDPVQINGLAAAILDKKGGLLTAGDLSAGIQYLDPGEAGPFRVPMLGPVERIPEIGDYQIYIDSEAVPPQDYFDLKFAEPQYYFVDQFDSFHLVGEIANNSERSLTMRVVAAIYNQNGQVLDVASTDLPFSSLESGSMLPYDFKYWGPLNSIPGLVDSATKYSVQWDPNWTYPNNRGTAELSISNETNSVEAGYAIYEGIAVNNSGNILQNAVVIVSIFDPLSSQILAMNYQSYFDELSDGQSFAYRIEVAIEPDLYLENAKVVIVAKGELAE